jgi:hypothetical protein
LCPVVTLIFAAAAQAGLLTELERLGADTSPATITALLSDSPIAASQTGHPQPVPTSTPAPNAELAQGPYLPRTVHDHGSLG